MPLPRRVRGIVTRDGSQVKGVSEAVSRFVAESSRSMILDACMTRIEV